MTPERPGRVVTSIRATPGGASSCGMACLPTYRPGLAINCSMRSAMRTPFSLDHPLADREGLGVGGIALDPTHGHDPTKHLGTEPGLVVLRPEVLEQQVDLAIDPVRVERDEHVGMPQITLELGD